MSDSVLPAALVVGERPVERNAGGCHAPPPNHPNRYMTIRPFPAVMLPARRGNAAYQSAAAAPVEPSPVFQLSPTCIDGALPAERSRHAMARRAA